MHQTVLEFLLTKFPTASRTTLRRMLAERRVVINDSAARSLKQTLSPADRIEVKEKAAPVRHSNPALDIIHEDADIIVVNKPAGLLTSTTATERRPTLWAMVRRHILAHNPRAQPGLIHRLDKDASGLLVFSRNHRAYQSLKRQFFDHTVDRIYAAVVIGTPNPPAGSIASRLVERADGSVYSSTRPGHGDRAITQYETVHASQFSLLRVQLYTGRKHQIRVHLSERGCPIVGDSVYGPAQSEASRLMLAAVALSFIHPRTGRKMALHIPPPPELCTAAKHRRDPSG